jgi:hypothetical protein
VDQGFRCLLIGTQVISGCPPAADGECSGIAPQGFAGGGDGVRLGGAVCFPATIPIGGFAETTMQECAGAASASHLVMMKCSDLAVSTQVRLGLPRLPPTWGDCKRQRCLSSRA